MAERDIVTAILRLLRKTPNCFCWKEHGGMYGTAGMYAQATPIPITLENENGQLWVDKYYLAYRLLDGVTHYVYLSRTHIREEYRNYQAAAASRDQHFAMPVEYQRIFHKTGFSMFLAGHQIWIEKKFLEKISEKQGS